jgi:hypothetical protein
MPRKTITANKKSLLDVDDEDELDIKINESYAKKFEVSTASSESLSRQQHD